MKEYMFYGASSLDIKDSFDKTPKDYYDLLSTIWSKETCAPRMQNEWSKDNKTLGQCSITAFIVQDIFGGKGYGFKLKDGN